MILTNDSAQNLQLIKLLSLRAFPENQVLAEITAAQAILESRLHGVPSKLAKDYNNLFGIKGLGTHKPAQILMNTQEHSNSQGWFEVHTGFAWNNTLEDSLEQHGRLLNLPRYKRVKEAADFVTAAKMLVACGYATDPGYANKLIKIKLQYLGDMV